VNNTKPFYLVSCADLIIMAEHELAAFLRAVTELYGAEQAESSAEVWLDELIAMNGLPGPASRDWRTVTVAALRHLASRLTTRKVLAIPPHDCSVSACPQ
jgi:hypothetical protein